MENLLGQTGRLLFMSAFSPIFRNPSTFSTQTLSTRASAHVFSLDIVASITFCVVMIDILFYRVPRIRFSHISTSFLGTLLHKRREKVNRHHLTPRAPDSGKGAA